MYSSLSEKYQNLIKKYNIDKIIINEKKSYNGTVILRSFMQSHKQVAIYGYGALTKRLMSDFVFELKNVKYIIDDDISDEDSGYTIISESEINNYEIDGIILCSEDNINEIIDRIKRNNASMHFLSLSSIYGSSSLNINPNLNYEWINRIQNKIDSSPNINLQDMANLMIRYIVIKDFRLALDIAKRIYKIVKDDMFNSIIIDLNDLYKSMINVTKKKSNNVLLLCIDGLKRIDMPSLYMPKLSTIIYKKSYRYTNAYSVSTSTFESLIPTYSENDDLRTKYYESNVIPFGKCKFINEANKQGRNIYFYTDIWKYIDDVNIKFTEKPSTAAEKIWDFLVDYEKEEYGLFYVHINAETHYSFPNPYTKELLFLNGTNIIIDEYRNMVNGEGHMRTDYSVQKRDSLHYIDDLVSPFMENLSCRTLIFADHGNLEDFVYSPNTKIEDIPKLDWSCAETRIRIPLVIISPEMGIGESDDLISLMELNNILISLMNNKKFDYNKKTFIKVLRSAIYNPELKFLCKITNAEHELHAFECFIFVSNYKLVIYSDGSVSLYYSKNDREVANLPLKKMLFSCVINDITVCEPELCLKYLNNVEK